MKQDFYIVNTADRPQASLVAYKTEDGKLNYLDRTKKQYDGMSMTRATPLESFGIYWTIEKYHDKMMLVFKQMTESVACYENGDRRHWQGEQSFVHEITRDLALMLRHYNLGENK